MSAIDLYKIQEAQLAAARDKLLQSVGGIIDNLRDISQSVMEISQKTQELSHAATGDGHSFLAEMEGHLVEVSSGLSQYGAASHDLASLMSSVAPAIGDMAACVRDIEGIEIAIERIALNACIKAAHLREDGAALGVLAEGIQHLVGDTRQQTVNVSQKLESVIATAQELNVNDGGEKDAADREMSLLITEIGTIMQSLHTLDEKAHADLEEVQEKGRFLAADLQRFWEGIDVHERAAETIDQILGELSRLSKQFEAGFVSKELERIGRLEAETLQDNYAMKAERLVHVSIAAPGSIIDSESVLSQIQSNHGSIKDDEKDKQEDLGDNVELF